MMEDRLRSSADSDSGIPEKRSSIRSLSNEKKEEAEPVLGLNVDQKQDLKYDKVPWYLRVPFGPSNADPPNGSLDDAPLIPEANASFLSLLTFNWITHLLALGYARPLYDTDLYKLQDHRASALIADKIVNDFERRRQSAEIYNIRLINGQLSPNFLLISWWQLRGNRVQREKEWRERKRKKPSLVLAMNSSVKYWFWSAGFLRLFSDVAQITSPLVVKAIINFAQESFGKHEIDPSAPTPPLGKGIGLAIVLFVLQLAASLAQHHFFYRSSSTGVLLRGGLITAIYNRSLKLTSRARSTLTNGKLVNHISTDVSRIDFCCQFFHMSWTAPIQIVICLILLLLQLGPSALAGFALFVIAVPFQTRLMKLLFLTRKKSMVWTDRRVKLLQELLGGMRILKFFAWEEPYLERIARYRGMEIKGIRTLLLLRSANFAIAFSLPALASVLSFVAYSLSGHPIDPAVIFTSLSLFQILRIPLVLLPTSYGGIADARNAVERLHEALTAEVFEHSLSDDEHSSIDPNLPVAVEVKDAEFTWDAPPMQEMINSKEGKTKHKEGAEEKPLEERVFKMSKLNLSIPKGQLCAIVGPVGSGKSSLLQGLLGEMRRTSGSVKLGGNIGYCPQTAWIQNATVRENVTFGRPFDEKRYWKAIRDSCLEVDLKLLPFGDMTEVGERGISLSGGQKQRLSLCRVLYSEASILVLDDPLSALDAHVGKAVFQNIMRKVNSDGKPPTRILVTHALHLLPQVEYIYTIVDGRLAEMGTYKELISKNGAFARYISEFGGEEEQEGEGKDVSAKKDAELASKAPAKSKVGRTMMQAEERNTGAVTGEVYALYLQAAHGTVLVPILMLSIIFMQGASVMSSYWLVYWQEFKWPRPASFYMIVYACLGISQAISFFWMGSVFAFLVYFASKRLHQSAIRRVMHAPMSFFDTTPLGRIMNRFSKDMDTIDNLLGDSLRILVSTLSSIIAAVILISIIVPYFLVPVFFICLVYFWFAIFYRASARELKRLDSILRSSLYSHFSETLSGLATIRAYGETKRFQLDSQKRVDIQNRAYWLTVTNQRWLGIRLDILGTLLTFCVAVLTVAARFTISPSQTGVTLSYILLVQQSFGWAVRQTAEVENNMNGVERIIHYSNSVEQEAPHEVAETKPRGTWPSQGQVEFENVVFKYRPELPTVLKGLSLKIKAGEKIGIVGRTGAGKSSIMVALHRLVEITSGSITIDGVDLSKLGLADLRKAISIIPQDPLLFNGTLRSNLDPFGIYDDAKLWDALKRSYLVDNHKGSTNIVPDETGSAISTPTNQFTLDTVIEDEGANLSVGQRSLVSLARALVKDSRVIVLDEATASVDYETDHYIQETISTEFEDRTVLCIAHRLRTIISYDRICVMDAGRIVEIDTPSELYKNPESIFRSMCDQSGITLDDIRLAAKQREAREM